MSSNELPSLTRENGFTVVVIRGPAQYFIEAPNESHVGVPEVFDDVSVEAFLGDEIIGNALVTREPNNVFGSYRSLFDGVVRETAKRIAGERSDPVVRVRNISVFPEYRGRGVGSVLLREALSPFEAKKMVKVRVDAGIADEWFGNRGFYKRQDEPVLESVCLFAVQKTIGWRREQNPNRTTYKLTRLTN